MAKPQLFDSFQYRHLIIRFNYYLFKKITLSISSISNAKLIQIQIIWENLLQFQENVQNCRFMTIILKTVVVLRKKNAGFKPCILFIFGLSNLQPQTLRLTYSANSCPITVSEIAVQNTKQIFKQHLGGRPLHAPRDNPSPVRPAASFLSPLQHHHHPHRT